MSFRVNSHSNDHRELCDALEAGGLRSARSEAGFQATAVTADVTTEAGRSALLGACPEADILINNNAGPSPRSFVELGPRRLVRRPGSEYARATDADARPVAGREKRRVGRIINITSAMVKLPHPAMALSSGARAGLTAVMKGQSVECVRDNVTINNLLPFIIDTDRQRWLAHRRVEQERITFEQARADQIKTVAAKTNGRPARIRSHLCIPVQRPG